MIAIDYLRECLSGDETTGTLRWLDRPARHFKTSGSHALWRSICFGKPVGNITHQGYVEFGVTFSGKLFRLLAHRVIWALHFHRWPEQQLDHIDGDRANNRLSNLRDVSRSVNMQNQRRAGSRTSTGLLGVSMHTKAGRFQAQITLNGRTTYLGLHDTAEQAHEAYIAAKRGIHPGGTL